MNAKMILPLLLTLAMAQQGHAAQGTAKAKMKVISAVAINTVSDLIFTEASPGAAAESVDADTVETAQNASFSITGEPNRALTITLPSDGTIKMINASGSGSDAEIAVNQFSSNNPSALDASGEALLFVGATRDALSSTQIAGDYEGDFIVDVVYQ